jgi:hypothetical protein
MMTGMSARRDLELILTDRLGTPIIAWIRDRRPGTPWRKIAHELSAVTGVTVSHETLRTWDGEQP